MSDLYMLQARLAPQQPGCPWQCPGWQWSPACSSMCTWRAETTWPPAQQYHGSPTARVKEPGAHESVSSPGHGQHRRDVGQLVSGPRGRLSRTHHLKARSARISPEVTHSSHSPQRSRNPSLPRASLRAKLPQHRDNPAGATLPQSVMETLVPVPCPQLPQAQPCRQSGGTACPGQAPASQPGGRRPRKHKPTPAAPRLCFAPAAVPGSIALPRVAAASSSPATTCKRGRIFQAPPARGSHPAGQAGSGERIRASSPLLSRGTGEKQCEVPRSPRGWVGMDGRQSTGVPGQEWEGGTGWETPRLGAGNPTSPDSGSLVRALGEVNRGRGTAEDPREGESVPGRGGAEWCRGRGSRSVWLPAVTGSRGGAACAAPAGAKSGDSGLSAAEPHTVAPWRQGRGRLRLRARDGSGCGQGWGSLRAGSGPALPPPRGRGHFVGTRSGYSGPARSAGEAGGGDEDRPRFSGISANRPAAELDGGSGGVAPAFPPQQREAGPGSAGAASPRRWGTQGAAKTPGLLPCAVLRAWGAADGTGGKATPISPPLLGVGALQPQAGVVAQAGR